MTAPIVAMREPTYFVLASLLDGPLHGYAIIKRAEGLSRGRVRLATGTLYTALDRLTAEGYVRLVREEIVSGRARRSYGLTDAGAAALHAEAKRMADAASLVIRARPAARSRRVSPAGASQGGASAGRASRKVRPA
jgi:DNA-binding PadR family transcriptional regulator